jgi:hypothetical protein
MYWNLGLLYMFKSIPLFEGFDYYLNTLILLSTVCKISLYVLPICCFNTDSTLLLHHVPAGYGMVVNEQSWVLK